MKLDYPLIIVIAGAFILGYCVASYKPKKEPAIDLTGAHMETHGWFKKDSLGALIPVADSLLTSQ